jgi:hypothetical protein
MLIHATPQAPPARSKKLVYAHGLPVAWLVTHHRNGKTWTVRVRITTVASSDHGGFASTPGGSITGSDNGGFAGTGPGPGSLTTAVSKTVGKRDHAVLTVSPGKPGTPSNTIDQEDNGGFAGQAHP